MCGPAAIPIATLVLTAASTAFAVSSQRTAAHAQEQANQKQYENDMLAYRHNLENIEVNRNELQADATDQINTNNRAARAAKSTATVSAGEAGVSGLSVNALLADLSGKAGFDNTNVEENYLRQNYALNVQRENAFTNTASHINSLPAPIMPDYAGAALRIGQAGLQSYGAYQQNLATIAGRKG